jgi:all-trans-8'-apo-beta-carotenal 15,15'-oxygenase
MEPLYEEYDLPALDRIDGAVPTDMKGMLYRVGPGKHEVGGHAYSHWFDGDGMVRAFRFDGGRVAFKNRYVRTRWFEKESEAGRPLYPNFGSRSAGGMLKSMLQGGAKNPANTNIVQIGGRLLALWEGGRPFRLDPDTLTTEAEENFGGALRWGAFFSAHPHLDATTGDVYNLGTAFGPAPAMNLMRMRRGGSFEHLGRIPVAKPFMVHDFCLTARSIVIVAGPLYIDLRRMVGQILGRRSMLECFEWHEDEPLRIYVADRNGGGLVRRYELPTSMMVHGANAFDEGSDTIVDCVLYTEGNPVSIVDDAFQGRIPTTPPGQLTRLRLSANGTARTETIAPVGIDFPRIDDRRSSQRHRYVYALEFENASFGSSRILRLDADSGQVRTHDFGAGCYAGEPVFAARPGGSAEDEGWLLTMVYDARDHHSFLGIVAADRFGEEETRVHLPFHNPLEFHGNFYPR